MEQSPSREVNQFSASQEIPRILWNPKDYYRIYKCPRPVPILSQINQSIPAHPTTLRSILLLSSHLRLDLPSGLFPSSFPTRTLYTPLLSLTVLHAPPTSFFSILSLGLYYLQVIITPPFTQFQSITRVRIHQVCDIM